MKKLVLFTALLVLTLSVIAQDYKYGKISKAELLEKIHPLDSSANAAVLYRVEDISFKYVPGNGFTQTRLIQERVKIYNTSGKDYATKRITLYSETGGKSEKIIGLKGITYNLEKGKISKEKLKNDAVFKEEVNEFYNIESFIMPNVQEGSVIEYTYKITSPFLEIDDISLQTDIPINQLDVSIATPQFFQYNKYSNPYALFSPIFKEFKIEKVYTVTSREVSSGGFNSGNSKTSSSIRKYEDNVIKISEANIPALKSEAFLGSINNYKAKLSLEIAASLDFYGTVQESYATSWGKVSKSIYNSSSFGGQLSKDNYFKDDISSIVMNINSPFDKAAVILEFVKSKVKWNGLYGFYSSSGIKNAYKEGSGNIGDINLLLTAMLKSQGIEANPVLVSTKNNGIPLYPTRKGFNYIICMVENEGEYVLLDASERYSKLNILPERVLNWQGRLVKEDGTSKWISLMPTQQSQQSSLLNVKIEDDFSISGKVKQMITSNMALRYMRKYDNMTTDEKIKSLEKGNGAIEISDTKTETKDDGVFSISYNYDLNDAVDDVGGNLYFSPLLFMAQKENPFKLDERQYPIDFSMPIKDRYIVNIMIPENYTIESLPQSEVMKFKNGTVEYSFVAKQNGNFIHLSTEFNLKSPIIDSADYSFFKEFYGKIIEKQAEQVVLKKI